MGKKGILAISKTRVIKAVPPSVKTVNTVGSGDCVLAALIHSLMKQVPLHECARYASAVSSAHVNTLNVGDIDPALVAELTKKVKYASFITD